MIFQRISTFNESKSDRGQVMATPLAAAIDLAQANDMIICESSGLIQASKQAADGTSQSLEVCELVPDFFLASVTGIDDSVFLSQCGLGDWLQLRYEIDVDGCAATDEEAVLRSTSLSDGVSAPVKHAAVQRVQTLTFFLKPHVFETHMGLRAGNLPFSARLMVPEGAGQELDVRCPITQAMRELIQQIRQPASHGRWRRLVLDAKAQQLIALHLAEVSRLPMNKNTDGELTISEQVRVRAARRLIDEFYVLDGGLPVLADKVGLSRSKLSSGFCEMFGLSIRDYTLKIRMRRAKEYICLGEGNLSDLASLLGYRHASNVSAAIKKYYGVSPSELTKETVPVSGA